MSFPRDPRPDFPLLRREVDGEGIVWLDSASTTPKPQCVIDAVVGCYEDYYANVHRSTHRLGEEATEAFESARLAIAQLINATPSEIIFTSNTTEAINLLACGLNLDPSDEVVVTALEHHSNYLPWRYKATPVTVDLDDTGVPRYEQLDARITSKTKLAALAQISNVTGLVSPARQWIETAHARGVPVFLDSSQGLSHIPTDVRALDVDFLAFSSHKMLGPAGVGGLYVKREHAEKLGLYRVGGGMVAAVSRDTVEPREFPFRFEAGTPNIEGVIGFGAAVRYLRELGMENVYAHGRELGAYLLEQLSAIPGVRLLADGDHGLPRIGLATFTVDEGIMTQDSVARILGDSYKILVSGGLHCAHIFHQILELEGTVRASTHVFNTKADIDRLTAALREIVE